jgi:hypothetical protein
MAQLPVAVCYAMAVRLDGREAAARAMARLFAERLRGGIGAKDAAALAAMLDRVADGVAPSVALGFALEGRPHEFDRHLAIYERVEELRRASLPLTVCYERVAGSHGLSVAATKKIHLDMRRAHRLAKHPHED